MAISKIWIIRILSLCCLLTAKAQVLNSEALLWEVKDSIGNTSYVFGTMHVQDKRAFEFPDSMMTYLQSCNVFAGELNLQEIKSSVSASSILLPSGISLKTLLLKKEYSLVKKVCRKQLNTLENMMVNRVKPVFVSAMLSESCLKKDMPHALDEYLQREADKMGLEIMGLESAREQLEALETMPLNDQAQLLYQEALHFDETSAAMNQMTEWYRQGQLDSLYLVTTEDSSMTGDFGDAILLNRNIIMADRLHEVLKTKKVFCAIGAAHLPGQDGVLELLRKKGYRLRAIRKK